MPGDPVVHEFKALALFARGEYERAAAVLHAVLAVTPGMDWTTLIGLYPDVATYTGQLRALEDRCRQDPKAAAPRFVLAYHYLVAGHTDAAVAQLKTVLALEPGDRVARRLLASLTAPPAPPEPARTVPDGDGAAGRPPSVDLLGRWRGERDGSTFELSLDDRGRFLWQAARQGKPTATVSGAYALSGDTLVLTPEDRSPLRASLTELTPDSFRLKADRCHPGRLGPRIPPGRRGGGTGPGSTRRAARKPLTGVGSWPPPDAPPRARRVGFNSGRGAGRPTIQGSSRSGDLGSVPCSTERRPSRPLRMRTRRPPLHTITSPEQETWQVPSRRRP